MIFKINLDNIDIRNLGLLDAVKCLVYLALLKHQKRIKGTTHSFDIEIPLTNDPVKIFFDNNIPDENIPPGQIIRHPQRSIGFLIVVNMGPHDLIFSTNRDSGQGDLTSLLESTEHRSIEATECDIKSVFIQARAREGVSIIDEPATRVRIEMVS